MAGKKQACRDSPLLIATTGREAQGFVLRRYDLNEFAVLEKKRPLILRSLLDPPLREEKAKESENAVKVQLLSHPTLCDPMDCIACHVNSLRCYGP